MTSSYDSLAPVYDRHWGYDFAAAAITAFDVHLRPLLPSRAAVLDLCCGTGLLLSHLSRSGFQSFGVDESPAMLHVARSNAPTAILQQADMAVFRWDTRFQAAVSFYNSLNHARSLQHLRATLVNVASHLVARGLLLFDYVLPEAYESAWEWSEQIAGGPALRYRYDCATRQATCIVNGEHRIQQTCFHPRQIRSAFRAAGLSLIWEVAMPGAPPAGLRRLVLARRTESRRAPALHLFQYLDS